MRKCLVGVLTVALVLGSILFTLARPKACSVNRAAFERLEEGMSQGEVHAILGGPPGDYRTGPSGPRYPHRVWGDPPIAGHIEMWFGDDGVAAVAYQETHTGFGDAMIVHFEEALPPRPGPVELVHWRLERLKERWLP